MPHGHCCDFRRDSSPENPFEFICLLYPARRDHAVKCSVPRVLLHAMISIPVRSFQTYEYPKYAPAAAVVFARLSKSVVVYGSGMN